MGYHTSFDGMFKANKPFTEKMKDFLTKFNKTRRMGRNVGKEFGVQGEFFVNGTGSFGQGNDANIIDHNEEPSTQPGLWCQWTPTEEGDGLEWDGGEKFYSYTEWLVYLIHKILAPNGYVLNGKVTWQGEETGDVGEITVKNNKVFTQKWKGKKEEHTPANCGAYKSKSGIGTVKDFMQTDVVYLESAIVGDGEKEFDVQISRTVTAFRTIRVKAKNQKEAEELALNTAGDHEFGTGDNPDYKVESSVLIKKKK